MRTRLSEFFGFKSVECGENQKLKLQKTAILHELTAKKCSSFEIFHFTVFTVLIARRCEQLVVNFLTTVCSKSSNILSTKPRPEFLGILGSETAAIFYYKILSFLITFS